MIQFYQLPNETKRKIFEQISARTLYPAYAVEKDWWVIQTLRIIFAMDIAPQLVFKGGTSLSKAWNIIERFSEDVDLALDKRFLGFTKPISTKNQRDKLRKKSFAFIRDDFFPKLKESFTNVGFTDVRLQLSETTDSDKDPVIIEIYYPYVTDKSDYVQPRVLVEIGSRSLHEPNSLCKLSSLVSEYFPKQDFADSTITISSATPEKTFLEKIFLLHEEFQKTADKIRVERMSRHLYDIYCLKKTEFSSNALNNKELYRTIVEHRMSVNAMKGINYTLHNPKTIKFIPPESVLKDWENDYQFMCDYMIVGEKPSWGILVTELIDLQKTINEIEWTLDKNYEIH